MSSLLGARRDEFDRQNRAAQAETREKYAAAPRSRCCRTKRARANRLRIDWDEHEIASPWFLGRRYLDDVPLEELVKFIDWTFFFTAWELKGRYPAILVAPAVRRRRAATSSTTRRRCCARSSTGSC